MTATGGVSHAGRSQSDFSGGGVTFSTSGRTLMELAGFLTVDLLPFGVDFGVDLALEFLLLPLGDGVGVGFARFGVEASAVGASLRRRISAARARAGPKFSAFRLESQFAIKQKWIKRRPHDGVKGEDKRVPGKDESKTTSMKAFNEHPKKTVKRRLNWRPSTSTQKRRSKDDVKAGHEGGRKKDN